MPISLYLSKVAETREVLAERFPSTFMRKGEKNKLPLMIGITDNVIAALPELDPELIQAAIRDYCSGPKYARAMKVGAQRVDLEGRPAGTVSADAHERALRLEEKRRRAARELQARRVATKAQRRAEGAFP
ncbi:hypothetical protein MPL3356_60604 [Mesorhizobium plurifarium]|uniref:ProQ/FinO domain-containing protein n=1 Tax=Mesorhizobium plurifarium TaxID=69974 RepID=A0A090G7E1_MESPL|nr:hypothetical protein MPL3356_60604 [Mesorhizobium plurifarium]